MVRKSVDNPLNVPRTRDGSFSTDIFERYQRNEKALVTAMLEMYVTGVSTRKVGKIVETLCGKHVSKSYVSSITKILDKDVEEFRTRRIDKEIPYLMTDVIYIKVREERRVVSKAVHIAIGVDSKGFKNILGFMISESETEETWSAFYQSMIDRSSVMFKWSFLMHTKVKSMRFKKHLLNPFGSDAKSIS